MKITIDIEAKEVAELRALLLPNEQFIDSKIADVKKQIINEIVSTLKSANLRHTERLED